jgi:hypothetical protein
MRRRGSTPGRWLRARGAARWSVVLYVSAGEMRSPKGRRGTSGDALAQTVMPPAESDPGQTAPTPALFDKPAHSYSAEWIEGADEVR